MMKSMKRVMKDLKELEESPVPGVSVSVPDETNLFELHGNILISEGLYKGILLHTSIHIPKEYPEVGPAMHIAKGIRFDHRFHEHVLGDEGHGNTICNDMLTNFKWFFGEKPSVASGWTSGCTLKALLVQMTVFFSDPDLPTHCLPSIETIEGLKKELEAYTCVCGHSTLNPHPPINNIVKEEVKVDERVEYIKNRLMCGASRTNIVHDDIILGYPIQCTKTKFNKLMLTCYIEPISHESYLDEHKKHGPYMVSTYGHQYNHWLPLYINKDHYAKSKKLVQEHLMKIKYESVTKFNPLDACEVMCLLMNQTMIAIFNGSVHDSQNLIEGYCHLLQLMFHLMEEYPEIKLTIEKEIKGFQMGHTNKTSVPDIGVFMMKLFLIGHPYDTLKKDLLREYFARQVFWMNKDFKLNHRESIMPKRLAETFKASAVSNRLYMFLYVLFTSLVSTKMLQVLDDNFGLPPQSIIDELKQKINHVKEKVANYYEFAKLTNLLDVLASEQVTFKLLNNAVARSNEEGYTKIY